MFARKRWRNYQSFAFCSNKITQLICEGKWAARTGQIFRPVYLFLCDSSCSKPKWLGHLFEPEQWIWSDWLTRNRFYLLKTQKNVSAHANDVIDLYINIKGECFADWKWHRNNETFQIGGNGNQNRNKYIASKFCNLKKYDEFQHTAATSRSMQCGCQLAFKYTRLG